MMPQHNQKHPRLNAAFLKTVARAPGVYLMKNRAGKIIYVGKAKDLRKRLASYARYQGEDYSKTTVMVGRIDRVETIITRTEKEALILEASLIKKHCPKYNVILRDDKNYPLIKVTVDEEWPRVLMTRRKKKDKARYFGPFSSVGAMWSTLKLLQSMFPLRRCKGKEIKKRARPCLNHQMKSCMAPCVGKADSERYLEMVRDVLLVLEGRNSELMQRLKANMSAAVSVLRFEEAALYRDRIAALEKTLEKQIVAGLLSDDLDVFGFVRKSASVAVSIITVRSGRVLGQQVFYLAEPVGKDAEVLAESVKRYYDDGDIPAGEILVPFMPDDSLLLTQWLSENKNSTVLFKVPVRGDKRHLITMAQTNADQVFADREKQEKTWEVLAASLEKSLGLSRRPDRIECLDISNISGKQAVGSLVCFIKGEKAAGRYRHYKIKTVMGPDDYSMMAEVIMRRFERGIRDDDLPDLFMVDGGKGQLNVARQAAIHFGLEGRVELVGIAKEKKEEGEKLYRPGRKNPIAAARHSQVLLFLMRVRDESHRYGVTFHRKLRHKKTFASELDMVSGIGVNRKKKLLQKFGSLAGIKKASIGELSAVSGFGPELARAVYDFFHQH